MALSIFTFIDMIVDRKNLKMEIAKLIALFQKESLDAIE